MPPSSSRREILAAALACGGAAATAAAAAPSAEALAVIRRLAPAATDRLSFSAPAGGPVAWHDVTARNGRVHVTGSHPVAQVHGVYSYLKIHGLAQASWEGTRAALPARLPDAPGGRVAAPFRHRAYLNPCTYGYTTPWWDWPRWEREIDWMALHGVDMPLAMEGQECVWQALWREEGLSADELAGYFSGPAFAPWQRMGNIEGYDAPLPPAWILKKRDLQKRILARMRALGMTPILPAFGGYVPRAFAERHPQARIYRMRAWEGFHETYWLDPTDPLFTRLAGRFLALHAEVYGGGTHYLADSFNEMVPPVAADGSDAAKSRYGDATANSTGAATVDPAQKARRLAEYGAAIHASIQRARPGAVWVMQGWLFGADQAFWTPEAIGAFFSRVPDDGLMVLDIGNDRYPDVWTRAHAFGGKRWVYGYVHNYGGSNPLYGDLDFYRRDLQGLTHRSDTARLDGFGVFPEGLHSNSVVYEYLYDLAWGEGGASLDEWLATYARARYGVVTPRLVDAWKDLQAAAYRTRYWTPRWWKSRAGAYLFFKRPTLDAPEFAGLPGDHALLARAIGKFLDAAGDVGPAPLFTFDVVDAARHYLSGEIDRRVAGAVTAYRAGDLGTGDALTAAINEMALRLDGLLGVQPETLAGWIDAARVYGDTAEERACYVENARAQITVWGGTGNLNDYASKAWQGMYAGFYLPRWTQFLADLRRSTVAGEVFDQAAFTARIVDWERAWVRSDAPVARSVPADPLGEVAMLMALARRLPGAAA